MSLESWTNNGVAAEEKINGDNQTHTPSRQSRIRPIAVLLALGLAAASIILTVQLEVVRGSQVYFSTTSIAIVPLAFLCLVQLANTFVRRAYPKMALNCTEMICIYLASATAAFVSGFDFLQGLLSALSYASVFPVSDESARSSLLSALPQWATIHDPATIKLYYEGKGDLFADFRWEVWGIPLLFWMGFAATLVGTLMCLARIFEGHWTKELRLSYPLSELPVALSDPDSEVRKASTFKIGFFIGTLLIVMHALSHELPSFPAPVVPMSRMTAIDFGALAVSGPWQAMGYTPFFVSPFIVGLAFMAPLDMLFSCWFFTLFWRVLRVSLAAAGVELGSQWGMSGAPPYAGEQTLGALIVLGVVSVWQARKWIADGYARLNSSDPEKTGGDWAGAGAYYGAAVGLILLFAMETMLGLPIPVALAFVLLFVVISIAAARIRAEVGAPILDFSNLGPDFVLPALLPRGMLPPSALGVFALNHWFAETTRSNFLAVGAENFRIGRRANVSGITVMRAMFGGAIFAVVVFLLYYLMIAYKQGASVGMHGYSAADMSHRTIQHLSNWLNTPQKTSAASWMAITAGGGITWMLHLLRCTWFWWPLNAAGFALSSQWAGTMLWASFMLAWFIKLIMLRVGGLKMYRIAVPFMMGLVASQLLVGVLWACGDMALGRPIFGFCDH